MRVDAADADPRSPSVTRATAAFASVVSTVSLTALALGLAGGSTLACGGLTRAGATLLRT